ncbi:hypothetical protein AFK24_06480 [Pseudomonas syringae]|uniref:Uncharacterized protein n=1 Tax=Pseudomonas syringae TaxID=317 RepID=A0A1C7Z8M0_PSESX|nr:hypothetical protein AFK24_06480 [Pseudomonas syringae]
MLRILPLADDLILPLARQEIYFFNRIGQKRTFRQLAQATTVTGSQPQRRSRPHFQPCKIIQQTRK